MSRDVDDDAPAGVNLDALSAGEVAQERVAGHRSRYDRPPILLEPNLVLRRLSGDDRQETGRDKRRPLRIAADRSRLCLAWRPHEGGRRGGVRLGHQSGVVLGCELRSELGGLGRTQPDVQEGEASSLPIFRPGTFASRLRSASPI